MDKGYSILEDIAHITGASKSCGRCKPILQRLIGEHTSSLSAWQTAINWHLTTSNKQEDNE